MAKSLDKLVDFLLDEIALDGARGASLQDIVRYTKRFYVQPYFISPPHSPNTTQAVADYIDKYFIGQLWRRLARHKDVFIGSNNEYKNSTIDQIEIDFPGILDEAFEAYKPVVLLTDESGSVVDAPGPKSAFTRDTKSGPRIIASHNRVSHTVCGHEPDLLRVSKLEFVLLRQIGNARSDGILQGELGRITQQDKRSVPKRTEALQEKGYIVKENAYHRGHKTSRIFLQCFAPGQEDSDTAETPIRLSDLARQVLQALEQKPTTTQVDLPSLSGISDPLKRHMIDIIIQHLTRRGHLETIETALNSDLASNDSGPTLRFVRALNTPDLEKKDGDPVDLDTPLAIAIALLELEAAKSTEDDIGADNSVSEAQLSQTQCYPDSSSNPTLPDTLHDLASRETTDTEDEVISRQFDESVDADSTFDTVGVLNEDDLEGEQHMSTNQQLHPDSTTVQTSSGSNVIIPSSLNPFNTRQSLSYVITLKLSPELTFEPSKPKSKPRKKAPKIKGRPQGRPRKFVAGTEKFWQHLFRTKRQEDHPEFGKGNETGLMSDPECLRMFASRPKNFDETLVRALDQDLPVPNTPAEVTEGWVDRATEFLDRRTVGAFRMPSGTLFRRSGLSCPIVIKTTRLDEIETNGKHIAPVLFLSSSVAHSLRDYHSLRWYLTCVRREIRAKASLSADANGCEDQTTMLAPDDEKVDKGKEKQKERTPDDIPMINETLVIHDVATLVSVEQQLKPTPGPKPGERSIALSVSSGPPLVSSHGRSQRQRRPTQKALEYAQAFDPMEVDTGPSGSDHALPDNSQVKPRAKTIRVPSPPQKDRSFFDTTVLDSKTHPPKNITDSNDEATKSPPMISLQPALCGDNLLALDHHNDPHADSPTGFQPTRGVSLNNQEFNVLSPSNAEDSSAPTIIPHVNQDIGASTENLNEFDLNSHDESTKLGAESSLVGTPEMVMAHDRSSLTLLVGKDATPYYKQFIVELVTMCDGVVPHDASLLKRAMGPKSVEAHVEVNMNIKIIKTSMSALTQSGKLKAMQFAFQRNGLNHTKAILALSSIQPTDQVFTAMRTEISLLPPNVDYVPPELDREAARKPQGILRMADPSTSRERANIKRTTPARPKRQERHSESRTRRGSTTLSQDFSQLCADSPNTGFLTLKVPNIARIRTDRTFTSKYFNLPAQPLPGNPRRSTARGSARNVQWKVPKHTPLPKSLRAILAKNQQVNEIDHMLSINPALETFDRDVDFVAAWEQESFDDLHEPRAQEWNFINHLSFRTEFVNIRREGQLNFRLISFDAQHEEIETDPPIEESWEVFAEIVSKEAQRLRKASENQKKRKRKLQEEFIDGRGEEEEEEEEDEDEEVLSDFVSSAEEGPKRKRQRGPNHKWRRKPRIAGTDNDRRRHKRNYVSSRGIGLRDIPKTLAHRITTAIVVVRVLTGGLEKHLNWKLVARLIPGEPETMLHSRWRTLSTRYNNDFDAMVEDLQMKYLDALADDKVPSVNYDDIPGTNWEGIFAWAVANINAEGKGVNVTEIPPNRDEFLELNTVEVGEPTSLRHLYNNSLQYTQVTKEDFWCSVVFGTSADCVPETTPKSMEPCFPAEDDEANHVLARARSWVFAAVVTPHQSFDPHLAHAKLRRLAEDKRECEQLIEVTIKKLQNDKMVVTKDSADAVVSSDGSTLSGTYDWKLSTRFLDRFELNRLITSTMLKDAVKYKIEILDPTFLRGEVVVMPGDPYLDDGIMVAIFNLMNAGMLLLESGAQAPATRYGIDAESDGYKTRSMDKKNLYFSTILRPTTAYVQGDPSIADRHLAVIPRGDMDHENGLGLIPMWFDINHEFRADIWDVTVGAVTGLISCRPGISNIELVRTLGYALSQKDMKMITEYLLACRMIERTCTGWETTENWWFAVGTGTGTMVSTTKGVTWETI